MPIQSSFPTVADQVITSNKNIIEILGKINSAVTTKESSLNIQIYDENGVLRSFAIPSFTSLKSEINRLSNNINSLYGIDSGGSLIQTSSQNKYKKIITVDLNREPNDIGSIGTLNKFKSVNNWFFDSMLSPIISVELDLTGKIDDNVRKIRSRRYIIDFEIDSTGALTTNGISALNNFNTSFKGNSSIVITDFENWYKTTPGVVDPNNPKFDEQIFDLEPNNLLYDGQYNVIKIQEDRLNKKLWYVLNTLDYVVRSTNQVSQLSIGNDLIINSKNTSTRYTIIEVSTSESNPRVRLERAEGIEPIPVGIGTLKIYSPIIYSKNVNISVGYDERNVIFIKPLNADNNLLARNWSLGTGLFVNDLTLDSSAASQNGLTMNQFYTDYVYDYGKVLKDLVSKKTPNILAGTPIPPTLDISNFKVVQTNTHLTDTPDSDIIKQKTNYQSTLKSEINQISEAIIEKNNKSKFVSFKSQSDKNQASLDIKKLTDIKTNKSSLLSTVSQDIINLANNKNNNVQPTFSLRGFWTIPDAIVATSTQPQEIVQFRVQYKKLSADGSESPIITFDVTDSQNKAAFSNWIEIKTDSRKRVFNPSTGQYTWVIEDISNPDIPNINQLDIPIEPNEQIQIRITSISEVGWPESPVESNWSNILQISFPDNLTNLTNQNLTALQDATTQNLLVQVNQELASKGLDEHLSDTIVVNNITMHHDTNKILSGFKDSNGVALDLFVYLKSLQDRISSLEEQISKAKGVLSVIILRNNQEFLVDNGSETVFNIECEDYLDSYSGTGAPSGRVYSNNIYVVKDFVVKLRNNSTTSPLGLLSSRTYLQNPDVYNTGAPQTFWVNNQDELITSDISGQTKAQLDNQYLWTVNYDSVLDTTDSATSVTKVSENIGNLFTTNNSNSITNILSTSEYSVGFNEASILTFIGNNKSLMDSAKWVDINISVSSTTKLLTTIHPVVADLESIVETNSKKIKTIDPGDTNSTIIPINIYFKMNSLDSNQSGLNYKYIDLNASNQTVKHIKKIKFFLENQADNRPFTFSIKFNINRSKVVVKKSTQTTNLSLR